MVEEKAKTLITSGVNWKRLMSNSKELWADADDDE